MSSLKFAPVLAGAPVGGAENFYTRFVTEVRQRTDFDVRAFTRPNELREQRFKTSDVEYQLSGFGGKFDVLSHWRYRHQLSQFAPDVVMTFMNRATHLTPKGAYQLVSRLGHYYDLKYYRHCDYWVGITRGICDHLIKGGMPADRVVHIPNFVDEVKAPALARHSFDTPSQEPLLLAFGRLHVNKGFDVLLRALAKMSAGVLWLAGSGPEEAALKQLAESLGITHRVRFLGWREDINALLATADVFVCPSRHEGLGSIILESWYHGCPMVAAASQGPGELLTHGEDGLLVAIDDVEGLRQAMQTLIDDRALASQLATAGLRNYCDHYSTEKIIGQYQDFFLSIAKHR